MNSGSPPLVDWDHLGALVGDWDSEMVEIFEEFLASASEDLAGLQVLDAEPEKVRQLAHRLKGSSGNFGFAALYATAAEIERQAQEGRMAADLIRLASEQFKAAREEVRRQWKSARKPS